MAEVGNALAVAGAIAIGVVILACLLIGGIQLMGWGLGFLGAMFWRGATGGFAQGCRLMHWLED